MRLIGHHVTTLDSDGGVRIHMEFVSYDSTSARDGERVILGCAAFRGGRAKEAFGIIRSPLPRNQGVHSHSGVFSDGKRTEARGNVVKLIVVVLEGQGATGIALVAIGNRGVRAVDNDIGCDAVVDRHSATDISITANGNAARRGTRVKGDGPSHEGRIRSLFTGIVPGDHVARDGAARDAHVELLNSGRTTAERGATGVDGAFDGATADGHICLVYCGAGRAETVTIGIAARIDITFDGSVADNDIGRAIKGCIRLSLGKAATDDIASDDASAHFYEAFPCNRGDGAQVALIGNSQATADDITGLSAADLDMRTALHSAAGLAVRYSIGSLVVIVPG